MSNYGTFISELERDLCKAAAEVAKRHRQFIGFGADISVLEIEVDCNHRRISIGGTLYMSGRSYEEAVKLADGEFVVP